MSLDYNQFIDPLKQTRGGLREIYGGNTSQTKQTLIHGVVKGLISTPSSTVGSDDLDSYLSGAKSLREEFNQSKENPSSISKPIISLMLGSIVDMDLVIYVQVLERLVDIKQAQTQAQLESELNSDQQSSDSSFENLGLLVATKEYTSINSDGSSIDQQALQRLDALEKEFVLSEGVPPGEDTSDGHSSVETPRLQLVPAALEPVAGQEGTSLPQAVDDQVLSGGAVGVERVNPGILEEFTSKRVLGPDDLLKLFQTSELDLDLEKMSEIFLRSVLANIYNQMGRSPSPLCSLGPIFTAFDPAVGFRLNMEARQVKVLDEFESVVGLLKVLDQKVISGEDVDLEELNQCFGLIGLLESAETSFNGELYDCTVQTKEVLSYSDAKAKLEGLCESVSTVDTEEDARVIEAFTFLHVLINSVLTTLPDHRTKKVNVLLTDSQSNSQISRREYVNRVYKCIYTVKVALDILLELGQDITSFLEDVKVSCPVPGETFYDLSRFGSICETAEAMILELSPKISGLRLTKLVESTFDFIRTRLSDFDSTGYPNFSLYLDILFAFQSQDHSFVSLLTQLKEGLVSLDEGNAKANELQLRCSPFNQALINSVAHMNKQLDFSQVSPETREPLLVCMEQLFNDLTACNGLSGDALDSQVERVRASLAHIHPLLEGFGDVSPTRSGHVTDVVALVEDCLKRYDQREDQGLNDHLRSQLDSNKALQTEIDSLLEALVQFELNTSDSAASQPIAIDFKHMEKLFSEMLKTLVREFSSGHRNPSLDSLASQVVKLTHSDAIFSRLSQSLEGFQTPQLLDIGEYLKEQSYFEFCGFTSIVFRLHEYAQTSKKHETPSIHDLIRFLDKPTVSKPAWNSSVKSTEKAQKLNPIKLQALINPLTLFTDPPPTLSFIAHCSVLASALFLISEQSGTSNEVLVAMNDKLRCIAHNYKDVAEFVLKSGEFSTYSYKDLFNQLFTEKLGRSVSFEEKNFFLSQKDQFLRKRKTNEIVDSPAPVRKDVNKLFKYCRQQFAAIAGSAVEEQSPGTRSSSVSEVDIAQSIDEIKSNLKMFLLSKDVSFFSIREPVRGDKLSRSNVISFYEQILRKNICDSSSDLNDIQGKFLDLLNCFFSTECVKADMELIFGKLIQLKNKEVLKACIDECIAMIRSYPSNLNLQIQEILRKY